MVEVLFWNNNSSAVQNLDHVIKGTISMAHEQHYGCFTNSSSNIHVCHGQYPPPPKKRKASSVQLYSELQIHEAHSENHVNMSIGSQIQSWSSLEIISGTALTAAGRTLQRVGVGEASPDILLPNWKEPKCDAGGWRSGGTPWWCLPQSRQRTPWADCPGIMNGAFAFYGTCVSHRVERTLGCRARVQQRNTCLTMLGEKKEKRSTAVKPCPPWGVTSHSCEPATD